MNDESGAAGHACPTDMKEKKMFTGCLYGVRKRFLLLLYMVSFVPIGMLILLALDALADISPRIQLFVGMLYAVVCTIGWALFSSAIDIGGVAHEFDKIKDDVALKKIASPSHFAIRTVILLCDHFKFSFFNIQYAFALIIGTDNIFSDPVLPKNMVASELKAIDRHARESEDVFYMGLKHVNNTKYHLYIMPIWFAGEYLGCIGVFTTTKLIKLFVRFLSDMENLYIDDQLFHVLNK